MKKSNEESYEDTYPSPKPIGMRVELPNIGCSIVVPFVCEICGKCCRKIGVVPAPIDGPRLASYLKITLRRFVDEYLRKFAKRGKITMDPDARRPCPMLVGNMCSIYPARPSACRSFPLKTDGADRGIGCPGLATLRRAAKAVGRDDPYRQSSRVDERDLREEFRRPNRKQWRHIYAEFLETNPSPEAIRLFESLNGFLGSE